MVIRKYSLLGLEVRVASLFLVHFLEEKIEYVRLLDILKVGVQNGDGKFFGI